MLFLEPARVILSGLQRDETRTPVEGQPTRALSIYFKQNQLLEQLADLSISTRVFFSLKTSLIYPSPLILFLEAEAL